MSYEYLKRDQERVKKQYDQLMHEADVEAIEKKLDSLTKKPKQDSMDEIWIDMYKDVLKLKKNRTDKD
ncbi:hypothetical protein [Methanobacterium ferruginis]|uniref:hypothetical protein n=1 Tax=Methanobacterium ferruginis TaxID=710191 RepID=UPI00257286D9|nr:hypothetical protein [Methanobacterium ferruginis]BDZ68813.1 hypothetical protein GCM10025860_22610 [Methanobacterium ferruginis]